MVNAYTTPFELGFQQVNYQNLNGYSFTVRKSQYAMVGEPGFVGDGILLPASVKPTYYLAVLLKQILGPVALAATSAEATDPLFSAHVWCAGGNVAPGAVVVVFANAHAVSARISVTKAAGGTPFYISSTPRTEYVLTAPHNTPGLFGLQSTTLLLNGVPLSVKSDGTLPVPIPGKDIPLRRRVAAAETDDAADQSITVPAYSYGFIVLSAAGAPVCAVRSTERARYSSGLNCAAVPKPTAVPLPKEAIEGMALGSAAVLAIGALVFAYKRAKRAMHPRREYVYIQATPAMQPSRIRGDKQHLLD